MFSFMSLEIFHEVESRKITTTLYNYPAMLKKFFSDVDPHML